MRTRISESKLKKIVLSASVATLLLGGSSMLYADAQLNGTSPQRIQEELSQTEWNSTKKYSALFCAGFFCFGLGAMSGLVGATLSLPYSEDERRPVYARRDSF